MRDNGVFSGHLERNAFRASNGEYAWTREQVPQVVAELVDQECGILGGELWWVAGESTPWVGYIPQRTGPDGVYTWTTEREPSESWGDFVRRGAAETLAAVRRWPEANDLPVDLPGRILYNLTWVTREEGNRQRGHVV